MGRLTHIYILLVAAAICITAMVGCNTAGCLENRSSVPLAGFYSYRTGDKISVDSLEITGIGAESDAPLYKAGTRINEVYLPMRSTQESTSWQLAYRWKSIMDGELCDTITFDYSTTPYFASEECGVIFKYRIERMAYTKYLIDSIAITDSLVSNTDVERMKIFFRTAAPDDDESGAESRFAPSGVNYSK